MNGGAVTAASARHRCVVDSGGVAPRARVLLIAPSTDILGGQAVQAQRLFDGLRESTAVDVDFLAVNPRLAGPLRWMQRVKILRTLVTSLAYAVSLRRVRQFDVIHAFSASYWSFLLAPIPALIVARLFGKRTILNYHSGEADDHLRRSRVAVRLIRAFADRVVVPSGYLVDTFARFGIQATAIFNVAPLEQLPHRTRSALSPRFLANRNLEPLYNVSCVLRAFARIQARYPESTLAIVGDGSERGRLLRLCEQLELRGVTFVGRIPPTTMGGQYDAADIYLNSPNIDNMPISILEAFACGLPVVSTDAGGIPYIVRDGENGLLVPCNDDAALAAAAIRLLESPEFGLKLARKAREESLSLYSWPRVKSEWEQMFSETAQAPLSNAPPRA
jgi:glycosyltransferase involved in cell wall biosynthesis